MKQTRKWLFTGAALAAVLQTGLLYAGIEQRASILRSGHEIELLTEPVDPRDLMRGDYVTLGYNFSQLARAKFSGQPIGTSRQVYLALKANGDGIWDVSRAGFVPFSDLAPDEVQLRGDSVYQISDMADTNLSLRFGIERFYVPDGEGRVIEKAQRERRITALVAVAASGAAQVKALHDEGRQLYEEPLY